MFFGEKLLHQTFPSLFGAFQYPPEEILASQPPRKLAQERLLLLLLLEGTENNLNKSSEYAINVARRSFASRE